MAGARWVQNEVLAELEGEKLQVYAIWFDMFPGDSRVGWPEGLLSDERVHHFWDEKKIVGTWYGEHVTQKKDGHVEWDAYFLYSSSGTWTDDREVESWGRTIVATRQQQKEALKALFSEEVDGS